MVRGIIVFLTILLCNIPVIATEVMSLSTIVTPQNISIEQCSKMYKMSAEKLFYMTIAGIDANRFTVEEIQSKRGYILFSAVGKQFLATIVKFDSNRSILKVTPADNVYYFQPGIVLNLFKYVDVNSLEPVVQLSKRAG